MKEITLYSNSKGINIIEFMLYLMGALYVSLFNSAIVLYLAFAYSFVFGLYCYRKGKNGYYVVRTFLLSTIIPSNYVILLFSLFKKPKNNIDIKYLLMFLFILINIILNECKLVNVMFGILYLFPVVLFYLILKDYKESIKENLAKLIELDKKIIIIQIAAAISYVLFNISEVKNALANDWLVGTFGYHQGNIFLYFLIFSILLLKTDYDKSKNKNNLIYIGILILLAILTNSVALTIMFIFSYFAITFFMTSFKNKLKNIIVLIVVILLFWIISPKWITNYVVKLTDYKYFSTHIVKIQTYEDTFINIPSKDASFLIVGNGMGEYSSRAALTCTGEYIEGYNKMFKPSISKYTQTYILPKYISNNIVKREGTMYSPYSTIISIQGEYGIIGLIIFLIFAFILFKKAPKNAKIFILFFFLSCFIENYLEFAKVIFLIYLLYFAYSGGDEIDEKVK